MLYLPRNVNPETRGGGPDHPIVGTAWSKMPGEKPDRTNTGLGHQ